MGFIKTVGRVIILFLLTIPVIVSGVIILFALELIKVQQLSNIFSLIAATENLRIATLVVGCVMLGMNFILFQRYSRFQEDKIVEFDNPSGKVSLPIRALEDLIRRVVAKQSEIKDAKAEISISRKNLKVQIRLTLASEVSIPDITARIQDLVKKKLQDAIGVEESITVTVYVSKILPQRVKEFQHTGKDDDDTETHVPFQGYRA